MTDRYKVELPARQHKDYFAVHIRDTETGETRSHASGPHENQAAILADLREFCRSLNEQVESAS
jgi:hypothetical protein